jgi:hypothetical protein
MGLCHRTPKKATRFFVTSFMGESRARGVRRVEQVIRGRITNAPVGPSWPPCVASFGFRSRRRPPAKRRRLPASLFLLRVRRGVADRPADSRRDRVRTQNARADAATRKTTMLKTLSRFPRERRLFASRDPTATWPHHHGTGRRAALTHLMC